MTVVSMFSTDPEPARPAVPGSSGRRWMVIEIAPGGDLKIRRPADLRAIQGGRVLPREFMALTSEDEAVDTASILSFENPGRCYVAVEIVAFTFEPMR